jgi:hypothetical protein
MGFKYCISLVVLSLILAACAGAAPTTPGVVNEIPMGQLPTIQPTNPGQSLSSTEPSAYPGPGVEIPTIEYTYPGPSVGAYPTDPAYPGPGTQGTGTMVIPPSGYEPQAGDDNLKRGQVFLDLANSKFTHPNSPTSQVQVVLQGNLPDPCHSLRVVVSPPDANNVINLEVYSVVDPSVACTTVLEPFSAIIPLGSYPDGEYTVMVNGERLGQFSAGSGTAPAVQVTP